MRRFFIDQKSVSDDTVTITDQEARHISAVLRLKPGSAIELFDGNGLVYKAEISDVGKSIIKAKIIERRYHQECAPYLNVAQALVKAKKMDLIIQKATELGVSTFQPILSQHCDIKTVPNGQIERWQRISLEACKQCNRPTPMLFHPIVNIDQFVSNVGKTAKNFIFWENEDTRALSPNFSLPGEHVTILVGPEGGFTEAEVRSATENSFIPTTLGPRILRAETAAIAAISIVQFILGNLNRPESSTRVTP